ncbi:S26 family signal peptidase [Terricaulis sp.]|uniref:S26 family signal peptidase n=1 Tax=Terricaulis sp. TaxID=2768686 RepID=UPI002AC69BB4|nr:S26 family signal peptidase [Terricaulis sp.]MDZ4689839.1 S26 family signal peptidase [Terricaulis sp.]
MMLLRLHTRTIALCALVPAALVAASGDGLRDRILYNPSNSISRGFYARIDGSIDRGALVTVRALDVSPAYAAMRDFTDPRDRFIKRVAATSGQVVCARGGDLFIDGELAARRAQYDAEGRRLPTWSGCRTLNTDGILLLGDTPDSFDGRYWGPISRRLVEGVWRPFPG